MFENIDIIYNRDNKFLLDSLKSGGLDIEITWNYGIVYFSCELGEIFVEDNIQNTIEFRPDECHKKDEILEYTLHCLGVDTLALKKLLEASHYMDTSLSVVGETIYDNNDVKDHSFKVVRQQTIYLQFD